MGGPQVVHRDCPDNFFNFHISIIKNKKSFIQTQKWPNVHTSHFSLVYNSLIRFNKA